MKTWSEGYKKDIHGIWVANDHDGITSQTKAFIEKIKNTTDLSDTSIEIKSHATHWQSEYALYPESANILRGFDFSDIKNALIIGAPSSTVTRLIAQQVSVVDVIDKNYEHLLLSATRCPLFEQVDYYHGDVLDIKKTALYDAIILIDGLSQLESSVGLDDAQYQQQCKNNINQLIQRLSEGGRCYIASDNRLGVKYVLGATDERANEQYRGVMGYHLFDDSRSLSLSQWHDVLEGQQFNEFYAFPDFRFTQCMLSKAYCEENPNAWHHLERVHSREYYLPIVFGDGETTIYKSASEEKQLGSWVNSFLFVIHKDKAQSIDVDFVHYPNFERKKEHQYVIRKNHSSPMVVRTNLLNDNVINEKYIVGKSLSMVWRQQLLSSSYTTKFGLEIKKYYEFLMDLSQGSQGGLNIDAIPSNIIIDNKGQYQLIDREWQGFECSVNFVFYRGMLLFVSRHLTSMQKFLRNSVFFSVRDFINYGFITAGVGLTEEMLKSFQEKDIEFLEFATNSKSNYDLDYPLIQDFTKNNNILSHVNYRTKAGQEKNEVKAILSADPQSLIINLGESVLSGSEVDFYPLGFSEQKVAMFLGVQRFQIIVASTLSQTTILDVCDIDSIIVKSNLVKVKGYDDTEYDVFNSASQKIRIKLPNFKKESSEKIILKVDVIIDSHPVYFAVKQWFLEKRSMQEHSDYLYRDRVNAEISQLKSKNDILDAELTAMKTSKTWRLIRALSDSFSIKRFPKVSVIKKIKGLTKRLSKK